METVQNMFEETASITNYILGILLAVVAIDLVFHDELLEMT